MVMMVNFGVLFGERFIAKRAMSRALVCTPLFTAQGKHWVVLTENLGDLFFFIFQMFEKLLQDPLPGVKKWGRGVFWILGGSVATYT
jgi:hypothetical protein